MNMYNVFKPGVEYITENYLRRRIIILFACLYGLDSKRFTEWLNKLASYKWSMDELEFIYSELCMQAANRHLFKFYCDNEDVLWRKVFTTKPLNHELLLTKDSGSRAVPKGV